MEQDTTVQDVKDVLMGIMDILEFLVVFAVRAIAIQREVQVMNAMKKRDNVIADQDQWEEIVLNAQHLVMFSLTAFVLVCIFKKNNFIFIESCEIIR